MIAMRVIGGNSWFTRDLTLVDYHNIPFFILTAVLLFGVYIKSRKHIVRKVSNEEGKEGAKNIQEFQFDSHDVLMQPKKNIDQFEVPFKNFSLNEFYIGFALLFFYAYIFTNF